MAESKYLERHGSHHIGFPRVAKVALVLAIFLIGAGLLLSGLLDSPGNPKIYSGLLQSKITPSPQVASGEALRDLRATEDAALTTYGWVDRQNGVVHIPIDRAMDLLLQRGLPTRQSPPIRLDF